MIDVNCHLAQLLAATFEGPVENIKTRIVSYGRLNISVNND